MCCWFKKVVALAENFQFSNLRDFLLAEVEIVREMRVRNSELKKGLVIIE